MVCHHGCGAADIPPTPLNPALLSSYPHLQSTYTGVYKAGGPSNSGLTPEKLSNIHARVFNMNASPHGV